MEIKLTKVESEKIFKDALCNGAGVLGNYGISLDYTAEARQKALKSLENPCREDVWMQIIKDGGNLIFKDSEDENNTQVVTLKEVHERVQETPSSHLMDMINENDDAITSDCILQTVIFGEVVYG